MHTTFARSLAMLATMCLMLATLSACGNKDTVPDQNVNNVNTTPVNTAPQTRSMILYKYRFNPGSLTIPAGTTVTFKNSDPVQHNVNIANMNIDRNLPNGATFNVTFSQRGTFTVINRLANNPMRATITVQ